MGHAAATATATTSSNNVQETQKNGSCGSFFGSWARRLTDEFKIYATAAVSLPPEQPSPSADLWRAQEAAVSWPQWRWQCCCSWGQTPRSRLPPRPPERSDQPGVCISAQGGVVSSHAGVTVQHPETTTWQENGLFLW